MISLDDLIIKRKLKNKLISYEKLDFGSAMAHLLISISDLKNEIICEEPELIKIKTSNKKEMNEICKRVNEELAQFLNVDLKVIKETFHVKTYDQTIFISRKY